MAHVPSPKHLLVVTVTTNNTAAHRMARQVEWATGEYTGRGNVTEMCKKVNPQDLFPLPQNSTNSNYIKTSHLTSKFGTSVMFVMLQMLTIFHTDSVGILRKIPYKISQSDSKFYLVIAMKQKSYPSILYGH